MSSQSPFLTHALEISIWISALIFMPLSIPLSGCAPSSELPHYRHPHPTCTALDLSHKTLDAITFKATLECFNSKGDFKELTQFTDSLDAQELSSVLSMTNGLLRLAPSFTAAEFLKLLEDSLRFANTSLAQPDLRSGIEFLRKERTSVGKSFFLLPFERVQAFQLSAPESTDLKVRLSRSMENGTMDQITQSLPWWTVHELQPKETPSEAGPVLQPLFEASSNFLKLPILPSLRHLLRQTANLLRNNDLPDILRLLEDVTSHPLEPTPSPPRSDIPLSEVAAKIKSVECISDPRAQRIRAVQLVDDYQNAVTNGDLKDGQPRHRWTFEELKDKVDPVLEKMADPAQSTPSQPVWKAMLKIFRNSPEILQQWLKKRSDDYQLITYFYPGEHLPRVRLVNSLDRLELLLINSDFTYDFLGFFSLGNKGQEFLATLADAWGDEPPEAWPEGIRQQFPNPKPGKSWPKTLKEAHDDMAKQLANYENIAGSPKLPTCNSNDDNMDIQGTGETSTLVPFDIKVRLFNIRQVFTVMKDNLPDSGTPYSSGLKLLRNLFYELNISTPERDRNSKSGWKNNFSVLTRLTEVGILHQISRQLRNFSDSVSNLDLADQETDPTQQALIDFFKATQTALSVPDLTPILETLILKPADHRLLWAAVKLIFDQPDSNVLTLKQLGFYSVAQANTAGWVVPILKILDPLLRENYEYLLSRLNLLNSSVTSQVSQWLSPNIRALYENQDQSKKDLLAKLIREWIIDPSLTLDAMKTLRAADENDSTHHLFNVFFIRTQALLESPDYQSLEMEKILRDLLHFIEETPATGHPTTAITIRNFLSDRISSWEAILGGEGRMQSSPSDLEEVLALLSRNPTQTYALIANVSRHIEKGDFKDLEKILQKVLH